MTTTQPPAPFDLLGPLPVGTTVLEASAGTGKTFTIAGLVVRYVAEGAATMDKLLVVSFSRDSTRELRERVRERLVSARDGLASPHAIPADDCLLRLLADVDDASLAARRRRLNEALAVFDAATVTTTHGFCQQVLLALGTAADHDTGASLVESISDLVAEVADDLYVRKWGRPGAEVPTMTREEFGKLAAAAAADPATSLVPEPQTDGMPGLRVRIAHAVRAEVDRRKRRKHLIDYDDMLTRLAGTLTDAESGLVAKERLRARYGVVLVDEFQDTDPVQWSILREAFHGHRTLVLVGDPKQAIYGFRGADVQAYLEAVGKAGTVRTLPVNWRSDAALVDGMAAVFGGAALGDRRIRVLPVAAGHEGRLVDVEVPVRLRVVPRDGLALNRDGTAKTDEAREAVASDLAAEVVALLSGGMLVHPRGEVEPRAIAPGDIAVLVRMNSQAQLVQARLREVGVPVVVTGRSSVFATSAAEEWQLLLEALEQPHRVTRVRRLALGRFVGISATQLDAAGDAATDELGLKLREWAKTLEHRGVAALFEAISVSEDLQRRILAQHDGDRLLTDLRHIAQALHAESLAVHLGVSALLGWLRRRRDEAGREGGGQEGSRRLETDAAAVQVITVHTSKGLEFPVVLVPFAWTHWAPDLDTAVFHDDAGHRVRDVGGPTSPQWRAHVASHKQEGIDDELRLAYVALTRAQGHLLLWWAPAYNTPNSPLHRLLFHDDPAAVPPSSVPVPDDATALRAFGARAARSRGGLGVETVTPRRMTPWARTAAPAPPLELATFTRALDLSWQRTSYSALTKAAHDVGLRLGSEPEVGQKDDEADVDDSGADDSGAVVVSGADGSVGDPLRRVRSAWDLLPGGADFGTMVHAVLEELAAPGDAEALEVAVAAQVARYAPGIDARALAAGLSTALATPLGPLTDGASLDAVSAGDRLSELDFELPLAGGDGTVTREALLSDLVPRWREQCPTGPLSGYADALSGLGPAALRGYLAGSIDAVLRVRVAGVTRYLVVDYKTNRLGGRDEPLTAWHYRQSALERAMVEAHYPLQALLYQVALHRYLRWRQPDYDPARHLGGVLYLFLRGMCGPGVRDADGVAPGVFSWAPPAALIVKTSDLLV